MRAENHAPALDQLPRWVPPIVFAVLTLVVFRRYLSASAEEMLLGQDTIAAGIMFRSFFVEQVRNLGRLPLWNPFLYGGVPTVEAGTGDFLYPASILHFILPLTRALAWKLILHVYLAGVFAYFAARAFGVQRYVALFAGSAYLLSANLVSLVWGGQDGKMYVIALFPAALWLLVTALDRQSWLRFTWLGVVGGLMLIAHPQLAFYAYLTLAAYGLASIWHRRAEGTKPTVTRMVGVVITLAVAMSVAAVVFFPMYRYLRTYSPRAGAGRGLEYSASWSLHAEEAVSLFIPDFAGTNVQADTYWGKNPFKHNLEYGGAVVFVLGLAGIAGLSGDKRRWGLTTMAAIPLLYALGAGTPFFRLVHAIVPGVKNFRAPSLAMFLCLTAITLLCALALQRAWGHNDPHMRKIAERAMAAGAAVAALVAMVAQFGGTGAFNAWLGLFGDADPARGAALEANIPRIAGGSLITSALCAVSWGAMILGRRQQIGPRHVILALLLVTVVDLVRVDGRFIQIVRYDAFFPDNPGMRALRERLAPGERIFAFPRVFADGYLATHGIPQVFGYHGNQLRWYDQYTRRAERDSARDLQELQTYWLSFLESPALRALAARYVILPGQVQLPGYELEGGNQQVALYRNTRALAGVAVIPHQRVEPDSSRQLELLWSPDFNVSDTVLLGEQLAELGEEGGSGEATLVVNEPDRLVIGARTSGPAFLLVSRTFHPSWTASNNGNPVDVLRADYALMGVPLPSAGDHRVELRYRPTVVIAAAWVSALAWVAVLLATAAFVASHLLRQRRDG